MISYLLLKKMSLIHCYHNIKIFPPHPCSTQNVDKTVEVSASDILAYTLSNYPTLHSVPESYNRVGFFFFSYSLYSSKECRLLRLC